VKFEFRPVQFKEKDKIRKLCANNHLTYDPEFITRLLNNNISPKNLVFGCFGRDRLIGLYVLFAYKILFANTIQDAATATFNIIDKPMRKKGLGIQIAEKLIEYITNSEIDFVFSFIDKKLVGKWSNAINICWRKHGFQIKALPLIIPCFKSDKAKKPETIKSELPLIKVTKLLDMDVKKAIDFSEKFYTNFTIAELPNEQSINLAKQFPKIYHWFSIDLKGENLGYISCYSYFFYAKTKVQKQVVFNYLMIDDIYIPAAINAIISKLRNMEQKPDIYVINNSTLLNKDFYLKSKFFPGFSSFQPYIRCCSKNSKTIDTFQKTNNIKAFSLTVV